MIFLEKKMNFLGKELNVYKASLHNHSNVSDGEYTPQEIIKLYAAENYDVFAFTDHRKTNPVDEYDPCGMTLISGIELHPRDVYEWHLLALGVPHGFSAEYPAAQWAINAVNNVGGVIFCAHPTWCGIPSQTIAPLHGLAGIEVSNSGCRYIGKENNETVWDELTNMSILYPALATDDTHNSSEMFRNWTMIAAPDKSVESLIEALRKGSFYATQGPEFSSITLENGIFKAEFSEAEEVVLISIEYLGCCLNAPDYPCRGDYKLISSIEVDVKNHKRIKGRPFRCRIKDNRGRYAWTPVFCA